MNKKAQEEMVGFAMIIIIVSVIILILLGVALNKPETSRGVESFEVESFIQALMQHTTDCSTDGGQSYNDVFDLISECDFEQICHDGRQTCDVLNSTIMGITMDAWQVGENRPVKGYAINISADENVIFSTSQGNMTNSYKGGLETPSRRGTSYGIEFRAYY